MLLEPCLRCPLQGAAAAAHPAEAGWPPGAAVRPVELLELPTRRGGMGTTEERAPNSGSVSR